MDTCLIRPANEDDIPRLCLLYKEFHLYHVLGLPDRLRLPESLSTSDTDSTPILLRNIIGDENSVIFVATLEGKVVGLAEAYLRQDEEQPLTVAHCYGYLQSLVVSAAYRKRGLATSLLKAAQNWAREKGATEMQLETWEFPEGPLPFYERLGYSTLRRHMVTSLL